MTTRENTETAPGLRRVTRPALVIGPSLALVSAWLLLVATPAAHDEERAFAAAEACPASADATAVDCLRTVKAVIDRTEKETGKTALYWLYLTESDGRSTRTGLNGTPQQSPVARPGASVEVTYWRGEIRSVDFGSARRPTNADPRGDYRAPSPRAWVWASTARCSWRARPRRSGARGTRPGCTPGGRGLPSSAACCSPGWVRWPPGRPTTSARRCD
ncbi:hypothetical protein AB0935_10400 [Streptomyces sp. NPDC007027]|uniref:hypothetical protein n=1 Tax=unclassified Streptomyces TaxID=2593676 RepID=UPI0033FE7CDE